jgi:hypothetical protein
MNHLIKYIVLLFAFVTIISCSKELNVEPTLSISDNVALTSEENIKKILIGAYHSQGLEGNHGGYLQIFSDLLGSDNQVSWNGTFYEPREALNKSMLPNNDIIGLMWNSLYESVNQTNLVLDHLSVIKDENEKTRVEGEAKFLRALTYFELLRLFGNDVKAVPLRTTSVKDFSGDLSIKRSTTDEVITLIINDLQKAAGILPKENGFYADKYAALALLARVQLYLGNYKAAGEAAHDVIANSGRALAPNYAAAFNHDVNGSEDIFAVQITSQSGQNVLITFYASEENGGRGGDISINQDYLNIFDDPNDVRSKFYYQNAKGDLLTNKYVSQFGDIPLIRLAEMILIRAECNQRLNTALGASPIDDINSIRARSSAVALTTLTLGDIIKERQRELAFEGFAIYDIKRTKSSVASLPFDSPKLVMPIPQSEMNTNKLMEQNDGY